MKPRVLLRQVKKRSIFPTLIGSSTRSLFLIKTDEVRKIFSAAWQMIDLTYAMIVLWTNVGWGTRSVRSIT